jgi:hypothetical protein
MKCMNEASIKGKEEATPLCHSERERRISRDGLRDSSLTLRMTVFGRLG